MRNRRRPSEKYDPSREDRHAKQGEGRVSGQSNAGESYAGRCDDCREDQERETTQERHEDRSLAHIASGLFECRLSFSLGATAKQGSLHLRRTGVTRPL
jgi:hypothetical protein